MLKKYLRLTFDSDCCVVHSFRFFCVLNNEFVFSKRVNFTELDKQLLLAIVGK
jgi:hypothetical protein